METVQSRPRAPRADPEAIVSEFVEQLGLICETDGLPRIAGRIMGVLVIRGGPLSFAELSESLKISRGSVSTNTRLLEGLGVLERTTRPGERQDYFKLAANPYYRLMSRLAERSARAQAIVEKTGAELPLAWDEAKDRLRDLARFYRTIREMSLDLASGLKSDD
jgi:DNA-binding transcriptional regulator GbsR (MarR family)